MQSLFNTQHYFSIIIYKWQDVCYAYLFLMYMVSGCTGPSIKSSSTPWRHHWWLQTSSASHSPLKAFIGSGGVIMPAPDICSCMALVWSAAVNKEDGKLNILIYPSKRRNLASHPYNENFQSPVFIFFFFFNDMTWSFCHSNLQLSWPSMRVYKLLNPKTFRKYHEAELTLHKNKSESMIKIQTNNCACFKLLHFLTLYTKRNTYNIIHVYQL